MGAFLPPFPLASAACSPPSEQIIVEVPSDWRRVELGGFSSACPLDRLLQGIDNGCGKPGALGQGCVLFAEEPVVQHESDAEAAT